MTHYDQVTIQPSRSQLTPVVKWLLWGTVAVFPVQVLLNELTGYSFTYLFGLSAVGLSYHYYWQLLTYIFLHGSLTHIILNMMVLFFMGPETERRMGGLHFLILYLLSGILGGLGWAIMQTGGQPCVGASGAIFGVLGAFAALYPKRIVTVFLFFILPISMRAWVLVLSLAMMELLFLITMPGGVIANGVHLGGLAVGYMYASIVFGTGFGLFRSISKGMYQSHRKRSACNDAGRLDELLDKISNQGINSLSKKEREWLQKRSQR